MAASAKVPGMANAIAGENYIRRSLELYRSGRPLIVYDTETTGLFMPDQPAPEPWHIAALKRTRDGRRFEAERIVDIGRRLSDEVAQICSVEPDMPQRMGKPAGEVLTSFARFVSGAVVVGHNIIDYDHRVMAAAYAGAGLPVPVQFSELEVATHKAQPRYSIDTKWLAYAVLRDCAPRHLQTPNDIDWGINSRGRKITAYTLSALGRFLKCSFDETSLHNALADIRLCEQVLDELLARGAGILRASGSRNTPATSELSVIKASE